MMIRLDVDILDDTATLQEGDLLLVKAVWSNGHVVVEKVTPPAAESTSEPPALGVSVADTMKLRDKPGG